MALSTRRRPSRTQPWGRAAVGWSAHEPALTDCAAYVEILTADASAGSTVDGAIPIVLRLMDVYALPTAPTGNSMVAVAGCERTESMAHKSMAVAASDDQEEVLFFKPVGAASVQILMKLSAPVSELHAKLLSCSASAQQCIASSVRRATSPTPHAHSPATASARGPPSRR